MFPKSFLTNNHRAFILLCKKYKVKTMYAFGSSLNDTFNDKMSDIDIVVDLNYQDPLDYGEALLNLWDELEAFFGRKVDLLTDASIRNPYLRKSIENSKKLIYDGQREEILV